MSRIVEHDDEGPLVINREEMDEDVVAVCRCGLSNDWPYCDGSHAHTRDEEQDRLYVYQRDDDDLQRIPTEDVDPGQADPRS